MPATLKKPEKTPLQKAQEASSINAVVRSDRTGRLYPVEAILDGGNEFIVQKSRTVKTLVRDEEDGKSYVASHKITELVPMKVMGGRQSVTRVL
jgi:hypothetical protein